MTILSFVTIIYRPAKFIFVTGLFTVAVKLK